MTTPRRRYPAAPGVRNDATPRPGIVTTVRAVLTDHGPLTAGERALLLATLVPQATAGADRVTDLERAVANGAIALRRNAPAAELRVALAVLVRTHREALSPGQGPTTPNHTPPPTVRNHRADIDD